MFEIRGSQEIYTDIPELDLRRGDRVYFIIVGGTMNVRVVRRVIGEAVTAFLDDLQVTTRLLEDPPT